MARPSTTVWKDYPDTSTPLSAANINARRGEDLDYTEAQRVHAGTLKVFGDSRAAWTGTGTSNRRNRWTNRLAAMLQLSEENYAKNGTFIGGLNTDEIVTRVMQLVNPSSTSARNYSAEFQAPTQLAVLIGGGNDLGLQSLWDTSLKSTQEGYRTALCRLRQAANFEDSHASVVYTQGGGASNWSTAQAGSLMSGTTAAFANSTGNTFTITVPSYFPGGEIDLFSLMGVNAGGNWSITLDGAAQTAWDCTTGTGGATWNCRVYRLQGVSAGSHTIVGTLTSRATGGLYFDSWGWQSPDPGLVLVPNITRAPSYPLVDHAATDADVLTFNAMMAGIVAEFDSRVVLLDVDSAFQAAAPGAVSNLFYTDNVHPNDAGHAIYAQVAHAACITNWPSATTLTKAQTIGSDAQQALRVLEQTSTTGSKTARMGVATLVAGTKTITNEVVQATSRIFLSRATTGGTVGHLSYTISAGTSFTITSSSATETSTVNWMIVEPG